MSLNTVILQRVYDVEPPYQAQFNNSTAWKPLLAVLQQHPITLLYGSGDTQNNQAVVLRDFLLAKL